MQLLLQLGQGCFAGLQLLAQAGDFGQQRRSVLAGGLGLADGLGTGVAPRLQLLGGGLQILAPGFQLLEPGPRKLETTAGQALDDLIQAIA